MLSITKESKIMHIFVSPLRSVTKNYYLFAVGLRIVIFCSWKRVSADKGKSWYLRT